MKKPVIFLLITALVAAFLSGCVTQPEPTAPQSKGGTLYITINPEIAVTYDADGTVVSVAAVTEDAKAIVDSYRDYVGKECTQVVTELVTKIGEAGYITEDSEDVVISISFEKESGVPDEGFVKEMEQQVQTVVTANNWQGTVTVEEPEPIAAPTQQPTAAPTEATPAATQPPTEAPAPTDPPPTTEPEEPTGPRVVTDYTNYQGNPVSSEDECYYIHTTVYNESGNPVSQETVTKNTGALVSLAIWEYDGQNLCVSQEFVRYFSTGAILEHYLETYDAAGLALQRTNYRDDGTVSATILYSYDDTGSKIAEEEHNADGITVSRNEYTPEGVLISGATFFDDGTPKTLLTYYESGVTASQTTWLEDGTMRLYEEFYENGVVKQHLRWRADGTLESEFTAFHESAEANGIHCSYDASGNLTMRDVTGNPDGSPDMSEMWDTDGTYYLNVFQDGMPIKTSYTSPDGSTVTETYDYDAGTIRVETQRLNFIGDTVISMTTGDIISGYLESTQTGNYTYHEYANGVECKRILDGQVNPLGYTYRETTTYYANGQVRTSERYFYADGGHLYAEFDESGNRTFAEDTTECNYGEIG